MTDKTPSTRIKPDLTGLDYDIADVISNREPTARLELIKTLVSGADKETLETVARQMTSLDPYSERQVTHEKRLMAEWKSPEDAILFGNL